MGFRLSRVPSQFKIEIAFTIVDEHGFVQRTPVTHVLRVPTPKEREQYERDSARIKGRRVEVDRRGAALRLWPKIILDVQGYDDIEEQFPRDASGRLSGNWKEFFLSNDILQFHIVEFIDKLFEQLSGEEEELEKNSESSAEGS